MYIFYYWCPVSLRTIHWKGEVPILINDWDTANYSVERSPLVRYLGICTRIFVKLLQLMCAVVTHNLVKKWICPCVTNMPLRYQYALVLPICPCVTNMPLRYQYALVLPICPCVTNMPLRYQYALVLPICPCVTNMPMCYQYALAWPCICSLFYWLYNFIVYYTFS